MAISVKVDASIVARRMGSSLNGMTRCPHCSVAIPFMDSVWLSQGPTQTHDGTSKCHWGAYKCSACASIVTVEARLKNNVFNIISVHPEPSLAHDDIPEPARTFLQQALETLHAPDAAAVMAGSAVDAMLKHCGLTEGSLYSRIDQALEKNILTKGMADWAHSVRLGSNRPRHADKENPHVSPEEAKQSVEFAEALGSFLFVLTAKIDRGIKAAEAAEKGAAEKVNDMKP